MPFQKGRRPHDNDTRAHHDHKHPCGYHDHMLQSGGSPCQPGNGACRAHERADRGIGQNAPGIVQHLGNEGGPQASLRAPEGIPRHNRAAHADAVAKAPKKSPGEREQICGRFHTGLIHLEKKVRAHGSTAFAHDHRLGHPEPSALRAAGQNTFGPVQTIL